MIVALLMLAFGGMAIWAGRRVSSLNRQAAGWPTTPGRILERGVGRQMSSVNVRSFLPHVVYTYTVGGAEYTNDQVYAVRGTGGSAAWIRRLVDGLPDPIPVRYDPADPQQSCLLLTPNAAYWMATLAGWLAVALGLMLLLTELFPAPAPPGGGPAGL